MLLQAVTSGTNIEAMQLPWFSHLHDTISVADLGYATQVKIAERKVKSTIWETVEDDKVYSPTLLRYAAPTESPVPT